eukprot:Selendium_serpulae@DN6405_c0_g1_i3.p1
MKCRAFAGDNREWLASKAKTEYVSFFDCDDVMHPQRIEFLDRMLREHPSTEALLTGYNRRNFGDATAYLKDKSFDPDEKDIFALRWPYEALWEAPPIKKDWNGRKWDLADSYSEPNREKGNTWYLPINMSLTPPMHPMPHNGWLTVRRSVIDEIPYPNIPRGQDSLYNYRLLKNKKKLAFLRLQLGAYVPSRKRKTKRNVTTKL